MVVSTIHGKTVEITEEFFAGTFELPIDGLTYLNEVPKDLVFYARSIFSFSGEQAGSFDAVTHERFLMMAAINEGIQINWSMIQDLELGDFKAFPHLKILTDKTVNRYIAINDKISVEDVEGVADESRVKKTPMKKAVPKKRPATAVDEHISKKKRTRVGKAAKSSAILTVAQEAFPLQIVEPIRAVPAVLPSKPKRKAPKRRLKLPAGSDEEIVEEEMVVGGIAEKDSVPASADVVDKEISTADDVDNIIEQVIAETAQFETDVGETNVGETNAGDQAVQRADEMEHWFNVSYEEFVAREADRMVESGSDTDEEIVTRESFDDLRASISRIIVNQSKESRRQGYSHDEVLVKIKNLERTLLDTLYQQDKAFRSLIQSVRQENHNDTDVLSLALKAVRAQNAILSTDLEDARKEVKEQKAIIEDMDERLATVRSELLDFRAQAGELQNLTTQLGELVDYINRGGNDKKGEERRPPSSTVS
ncbi:hypothetical protein F511_33817 [Dorcoceras hygrometricum]|uniref:Uncharacterized protein n=1 Tax=Dorcoceras hygrometricum TaxID=472368 RepID=A0A2Z7C1B4_9LAMI|nr:hypothetical protein F511_33817 [Dorcoceras hygrometricum]